ncbi:MULTISPECIES: hypothetical protein [Dietzia]|uniref:hypothetical protein n=1 Tax=Dietzia TaxID=37914 RepID=UPI0020A4AE1B|nr:hypothetical protein [Dietzia sp. 111N12-1]
MIGQLEAYRRSRQLTSCRCSGLADAASSSSATLRIRSVSGPRSVSNMPPVVSARIRRTCSTRA